MRSFWKLTVAGLKALLRDRAGMFWSGFFPVFFVFTFGSIFGNLGNEDSPPRFPIGVVVENPSPATAWAPTAFEQAGVFDVYEGSRAQETRALLSGRRRAVVVFPADLALKLHTRETSRVQVLYDPLQRQSYSMVIGIVRQVIEGIDRHLSGRQPLLQVEEAPAAPAAAAPAEGKARGTARLRMIDFVLPGILGMTIMQLGLFTAIPLITAREKGLLKRLRATPLPRTAIVGSHVAQRLMIGLAQTLVIVGIGVGFYHVRMAGSWGALLALVLLGVLTFVCLGAVLSSFAKTQESGVALVQVVNFPMMFLSGVFFDPALIPAGLRTVTNVLPLTYLADALRQVMLGAPSSYSLGQDITVLGIWLAACLLLASRLFRWE